MVDLSWPKRAHPSSPPLPSVRPWKRKKERKHNKGKELDEIKILFRRARPAARRRRRPPPPAHSGRSSIRPPLPGCSSSSSSCCCCRRSGWTGRRPRCQGSRATTPEGSTPTGSNPTGCWTRPGATGASPTPCGGFGSGGGNVFGFGSAGGGVGVGAGTRGPRPSSPPAAEMETCCRAPPGAAPPACRPPRRRRAAGGGPSSRTTAPPRPARAKRGGLASSGTGSRWARRRRGLAMRRPGPSAREPRTLRPPRLPFPSATRTSSPRSRAAGQSPKTLTDGLTF